METVVGAILEGKVTGITKFGAFVQLEGGKSGLVHISEVANSYVSDINDFVKLGEAVKVKVIGIGEQGKINLSIKKAAEPAAPVNSSRPAPRSQNAEPRHAPARPTPAANTDSGNADFEDRLKKFMQESDSRIADNRHYADRRQRTRRR